MTPCKLEDSLFLAYLRPGTTLESVALAHGVDPAELRELATTERWSERKRELARELRVESDEEFDAFVNSNRLEVAEALMRTTKKFFKTVDSHLENMSEKRGKDAVEQLEKLSRVAKNIAEIQQRTVSISERTRSEVEVTVRGGPGSLFVPGVAPVRAAIDVEAKEV